MCKISVNSLNTIYIYSLIYISAQSLNAILYLNVTMNTQAYLFGIEDHLVDPIN